MIGLWVNMQNSSCVCWSLAQNCAFCSISLGSCWTNISLLVLCNFPDSFLCWSKGAWVRERPEQNSFQCSFLTESDTGSFQHSKQQICQSNRTPPPAAPARASLCDYSSKVLLAVSKASFLLGRLGSFSLRTHPDMALSHCKQGAFPRENPGYTSSTCGSSSRKHLHAAASSVWRRPLEKETSVEKAEYMPSSLRPIIKNAEKTGSWKYLFTVQSVYLCVSTLDSPQRKNYLELSQVPVSHITRALNILCCSALFSQSITQR